MWATLVWLTGCWFRVRASAMARVLLQVQRSGDSGSPRVVSSIIASSLRTSCGSDWVIGLRPPPGRRIRPGQLTPASISRIPLWIALRDKPHARLTRLTPPRPKVLASFAAIRRRVRSSKCDQIARNFALSSERVLTPEQHNADRCSCLSYFIDTFIYLRLLSGFCPRGELRKPRQCSIAFLEPCSL